MTNWPNNPEILEQEIGNHINAKWETTSAILKAGIKAAVRAALVEADKANIHPSKWSSIVDVVTVEVIQIYLDRRRTMLDPTIEVNKLEHPQDTAQG